MSYVQAAITVSYFVGMPTGVPGVYACASPRVEHELEAEAMLEQFSDVRAVVVRDELRRFVRGRK